MQAEPTQEKKLVPPVRPPRPVDGPGTYVVPKRVSVNLSAAVRGGRRVPLLHLIGGYGEDSCNGVGPLRIAKATERGTLWVAIGGYQDFGKSGDRYCLQVVQYASVIVYVDPGWLARRPARDVVFLLRGRENRYTMSLRNHRASLVPRHAPDVVSLDDYDYPPRSKAGSLEVVIYPVDVLRLFVTGSGFDDDRDYRPKLRAFARDHDFIPADEFYDGIDQPRKNKLYVVVRNRKPPRQSVAERIGRLPGTNLFVYLSASVP